MAHIKKKHWMKGMGWWGGVLDSALGLPSCSQSSDVVQFPHSEWTHSLGSVVWCFRTQAILPWEWHFLSLSLSFLICKMGLVIAAAYQHCSAVGSVTSCVQLFAARWIGAHQSLLSMGFSRQQYWSGHEELNEFIQEMEKAMATHSSTLAWKMDRGAW